MVKKLTKTDGYKTLVSKIRTELDGLEFLIKQQTVLRYWRVGKYISEHLLENKERASYGDRLYERLSRDVGRNINTLERVVRFYRLYPISAPGQKLSWSHYRSLLAIEDQSERKRLERLAIVHDWDSKELSKYIKSLRQKGSQLQKPKIIPQLTFTCGRLNTYRLLKSKNLPPGQKSELLIDCGFQIWREFAQIKKLGLQEGDRVEVIKQGSSYSLNKVSIPEDELFTYLAYIDRIIDGDTLRALIDCGFEFVIRQKLRLRGIDCPELSTPEGQRAKRFVQKQLNNLDFIIVKTYKDRTEKYGRYLADIFYLPASRLRQAALKNEKNQQRILEEGIFLNQELLDKGLASLV
ncbi:MAG: thermonuclease family protein [Candidatus Omnitrophica bacterium]|nr:thermonuclease family protein [Candidatus Omnitrophota bacterium]